MHPQGLNKLHTTELPTVVRRQGKFGLNEMKEMVKTGEIQNTAAFISTSYQPQKNFGSKLEIIYDRVYGVNVKALSQFAEEDEYLIPPSTQIKYTGYKEIDGLHVFTAEGANVLLDKKHKITKEDKTRNEIDELIDNKSKKMERENNNFTKKDTKEFIEEVLDIVDKNHLISKEEKDLYLNTNNEQKKSFLDKDVQKVTETSYRLSFKDRLCNILSQFCKTIGLKTISQKLRNKTSNKGLEQLNKNLEIKGIALPIKNNLVQNQPDKPIKINTKIHQASKNGSVQL